jgi:uncharacterized membrane protein YkvA (DUF1232 family)
MMEWWQLLTGIVAGLVVAWLVLALTLWIEQRRRPGVATLWDSLRLVPDVVRLLERLSTDAAVAIGVRLCLGALLLYLLSPIDLIPDFIPVLGYADDALVVAIAVRFAVRHAGREAVSRHWTGTIDGFHTVLRLAGLR